MTSPPLSLRVPGAILLISCYELGHQPLGIAWPKAFLERAGFSPATCDLAVEPLAEDDVRRAVVAAIATPMHTALRLGIAAAEQIRRINPACRIVFHGLYASLNAARLQRQGADAVLGGEVEGELVRWVERLEQGSAGDARTLRERLDFPVPSRTGLPPLARYVKLAHAGRVVPAGYVEATRGCLHTCLHCPVAAVYGGRFFAVPRDVVVQDIRRLVAAGAGHITFGDPDFLNGPTHALRLVRALHDEFPDISYDFTAKIEHLIARRELLPEFAATGCVFIVSAVESLSDLVLARLDKGHARADVVRAVELVRRAGIALRPTFIPFTPWSTLDDYRELLDFVEREGLIDQVDAVQYTIRLLVPPGSLLLSRPATRSAFGSLDAAALSHRWVHPDPRMDALQRAVHRLVEAAAARQEDAAVTFARVREQASGAANEARARRLRRDPPPERPIPARLTEPWFC